MAPLSNRPLIADLPNMPVGEIAGLPADQLALLHGEAEAAVKSAKMVLDRLDAALALRYADPAQALRREQGKDTGVVRFEDGPVTIMADLPKRVDWDQKQLASLLTRIRESGENPAEYVDITIKVPERKYAAWPSHIRAAFEPARTVKTGKPAFALTLRDDTNGGAARSARTGGQSFGAWSTPRRPHDPSVPEPAPAAKE
jgi:hypothetical protein